MTITSHAVDDLPTRGRASDLDDLGRSHPNIKIKLLDSLSLGLRRKLRKANREIE